MVNYFGQAIASLVPTFITSTLFCISRWCLEVSNIWGMDRYLHCSTTFPSRFLLLYVSDENIF